MVPLLLLGFGLLYLKLLHGPISIRFMVDPIGRALNAELAGFKIEIDDAVLRLSDRGGLEFRLADVRLIDQRDGLLAAAKLAAVEISSRAFLSARIAPSQIELIEPRITLNASADGRLLLNPGPAVTPGPFGGSGAEAGQLPGSPAGQAAAPRGLTAAIARSMSGLIARLRQSGDAGHFLETVGLRDAALVVESATRHDEWRVPELKIGLTHWQKRSLVTVDATIASASEPWTVTLRAEEAEKSRSIAIDARFAGLVPREVMRGLARTSFLEGVEVPLSGTLLVDVDPEGEIRQASVEINAGSGTFHVPWLKNAVVPIVDGTFVIRHTSAGKRFDLETGRLRFAGGRIAVTGYVEPMAGDAQSPPWRFEARAVDGAVAALDGVGGLVPIDLLALRGRIGPEPGHVELEQLDAKLGGAEVKATGTFGAQTSFEGQFAPMPIATLKRIWPVAVAPRSREFVTKRIGKGEVKSFAFKVAGAAIPAAAPAAQSNAGGSDARRLSLTAEAADIEIDVASGLPPLEIPRALLRIEEDSLELTVPDASLTAAGGKRLLLKGGRATVAGIDGRQPAAEVALRAIGPLPAVIGLLEREGIGLLKPNTVPLSSIDGKTELQLKASFPLGGPITLAEMKLEGKARVTDGRIKDVLGSHDITGATLNADLSEKGVDLKGSALVAGVHAKLAGQWYPGAPEGQSPPLRINAHLDTADRNQLGLDLDSLLQGDVPLEVTIQRGTGDDLKVHVVADLTAAELILDEAHWKKPVGRPARAEFDVAKGRNAKGIDLQNFKVAGENIAIEGWVSIGPDNKARAYEFPEFSLNVITNLEVKGVLRPDRVWEVKSTIKTFDGKDLFKSFLALGEEPPKPVRKNKPGVEFIAHIDTVLGANDTVLRDVKIRALKRQEQLIELELKGVLEGGRLVHASMRPVPGKPRTISIDAADAGQAFKLIGLYPNMVGGRTLVEVQLDSKGAVEKAGKIKIRDFKVLGDPVIAEVLQNGEDNTAQRQASPGQRPKVVREQFDFDGFDAVFAIGNSQVVIENAVARGPLIGASLRGKLDFKARRMQLGGTYVPLSGLSRTISQIPLIGQLLTGPRGEGVLGLTFAIEGPMEDPKAVIHPLSLVAPGILREIFQLGPDNPKVTPRAEPVSKGTPLAPQVRASPPIDSQGAPPAPARSATEVIDGWVTTQEPKAPRKKPPAPAGPAQLQ